MAARYPASVHSPLRLAVLALTLSACSTMSGARPLARGEHAVGVTVGGALLDFGGPLPLPNIVVEGAHGVAEVADHVRRAGGELDAHPPWPTVRQPVSEHRGRRLGLIVSQSGPPLGLVRPHLVGGRLRRRFVGADEQAGRPSRYPSRSVSESACSTWSGVNGQA